MADRMVSCVQCGSPLAYPSASFCSFCGDAVVRIPKSPFQSGLARWIALTLIISFVAEVVGYEIVGEAGGYLGFLVLALAITWLMTKRKISFSALAGKLPTGYNWWPVLLMAVGLLVYADGAIIIVMVALSKLDPQSTDELLFETFSESHLHFFITAVILAPIFEEILFRGLLFSRLARKWGMTVGIIASSVIFGILHLEFVLGAFVIGVVMCALYVRTGTLLVPMALHAVYNLSVWLLTVAELDSEIVYTSPEYWSDYAFEGLIAMVIGAPIVFMLLGKWWPSESDRLPYELNESGAYNLDGSDSGGGRVEESSQP